MRHPKHWQLIAPGHYFDPLDGTIHVDAAEVCIHLGLEPTEVNQEAAAAGARAAAEKAGCEYLGTRIHSEDGEEVGRD